MAIKVGGVEVISNSRELTNIASIDAATVSTLESVITTDPTLGTLSKSFFPNESATITLSASVSPTPVISVTKEYGQVGVSSKGSWDVTADASNYEFYNQAPDTSLEVVGPWDLAYASASDSGRKLLSEASSVYDIYIKPDGTKVFVVDNTNNKIIGYFLTTPWDITTAFKNQEIDVSPEGADPRGIYFKPDGTKMYVSQYSDSKIYQYSLGSAWDVSTATPDLFLSKRADGLFFKEDGTGMYFTNYHPTNGQGTVVQNSLSTPWDISTSTTTSTISVSVQDNFPRGLYFKPDGTKMYVIGTAWDRLHEYTLSTPWSISSQTFVKSFNNGNPDPHGFSFKPDGSRFFIVKNTNYIYQHDFSYSFSLGTGSFTSDDVYKVISVDDESAGRALLLDTSGSYNLLSGSFASGSYTSGNWSLSGLDVDPTGGITISGINTIGDISDSIFVQDFSVATQEGSPSGVTFKPDGTKMYVIGTSSDSVHEYDLSTAWDISTATILHSLSVSSNDSVPTGLFFKPDGTVLYISGDSGKSIDSLELGTPWDISTAVDLYSAFVGSADPDPQSVFFKPDGTKMYFNGSNGVHEYDVGTAWDLSTITFVKSNTLPGFARDISFSADGTTLYITDGYRIKEYALSTAWDIGSMSLVKQSSDLYLNGNFIYGSYIRSDLLKLYTTSSGNDTIVEFDVGQIRFPPFGYYPAVTNASGQIDTKNWSDINAMTADDTDNDGQVYYAVSTDNRSTWSTAKGSSGVRNIIRNNGGTWQYNSETGAYIIANSQFVQSYQVTNDMRNFVFKPDGTRLYTAIYGGVREISLGTAWDISTVDIPNLKTFATGTQESNVMGIFFKPDGTQMYITGPVSDSVHEYELSTAWDISTATFVQSFNISAQGASPYDIFFREDGLRMYMLDYNSYRVYEYSLGTAWDISTLSYSNRSYYTRQYPRGITISPDGKNMYMCDQYGDVYHYVLSTAWRIDTAANYPVYPYFIDAATPIGYSSNLTGVFIKPDGTKLYAASSLYVGEFDIPAFSTGETWINATTNTELAALAEAVSFTANQMDKAQLDAVADESHFAAGGTLDLAIIPYMSATGEAPKSDGVSINHDIAGLNKGAILGTDYEYDVIADNKVRITSLAEQNLKVRVV